MLSGNGKRDPKTEFGSKAAKDPGDWVSGDDPMTASQAAYLKTLSEQAQDPTAFEEKRAMQEIG